MSLPIAAIDRLFDRMNLTYGTQFVRMWSGLDINDVKSSWAYELGIFAHNLNAIGWALEHLPERCPNLIEFKALCKQAPRPQNEQLLAPKADEQVVDAELARIASNALSAPKNERGDVDHKVWAKTLQKRHERGESLSTVQIDMYMTALNLKPNPINV